MKPRRKRVYELHIGSIEEIRQEHSIDKTDKRLYCDITLDTGIKTRNVPFWGGGVDPTTKNPHGIFAPPVENQIVGILYIEGHYQNPVACFPFPHPMDRKNIEKYYDILDDVEDILIAHKSGSKIIMRANGDIEVIPASGKEVLIGEGALEKIIKGETFQTFFNSHVHPTAATGSPSPPTVPMSATQLSQKNKVGT